jgi:hypothetical protein
VEIIKETMVPETYYIRKMVEVPEIRKVTSVVYEPVEKITEYIEKVPVIIEKNVTHYVPHIVMVNKTISTPKKVFTSITEDQETEIEIDVEYKVPVTTQVEVEVQVPVDIPEVVTIQQAVVEFVRKVRNVPCVEEEVIPDPPCHWHDITHSHGVEIGKMHKHNN